MNFLISRAQRFHELSSQAKETQTHTTDSKNFILFLEKGKKMFTKLNEILIDSELILL